MNWWIICGFNTQPPEGGCVLNYTQVCKRLCFNTQPPEGGCKRLKWLIKLTICFNTQPPEGGCQIEAKATARVMKVSTHSHPKVAALERSREQYLKELFQHTATRRWLLFLFCFNVIFNKCFNTQPPEGGCRSTTIRWMRPRRFNTQPPEGGCSLFKKARKISVLNTVFR